MTTTHLCEPDPLILALCRELRIVDDARVAARQELDEIATLVVRANPLDALPLELRGRLSAATGRIDDLEARREIIRMDLERHGQRVAETVPVRVV